MAVLCGWEMVRLGMGEAGPWLLLGWMSAALGVVWRDEARPSDASARWRLAVFPAVLVLVYFRLGVDVPRLVGGRADAVLLAWDRRWLGETPAVLMARWHAGWLTEALSACYLAYFPAYVGFLAFWLRSDPGLARRFVRGFCWIQAMGFAGYCWAPASGPFVFLAGDLPVLPMGLVGRWNDWVVRAGCNGVDVFPSLHVATTLYWLGFDALERRWRRVAWLLLPGVGLCLSTLYLRYHYAADVLAGMALGCLGLGLSRRRIIRGSWPREETNG